MQNWFLSHTFNLKRKKTRRVYILDIFLVAPCAIRSGASLWRPSSMFGDWGWFCVHNLGVLQLISLWQGNCCRSPNQLAPISPKLAFPPLGVTIRVLLRGTASSRVLAACYYNSWRPSVETWPPLWRNIACFCSTGFLGLLACRKYPQRPSTETCNFSLRGGGAA